MIKNINHFFNFIENMFTNIFKGVKKTKATFHKCIVSILTNYF